MNLLSQKISDLFEKSHDLQKFFTQINLPLISEKMTLGEVLKSLSAQWLRDAGFSEESLLLLIKNILKENEEREEYSLKSFKTLTIQGGKDKTGKPEDLNLTLFPGDIYAVTGLTGSGKTQFLEDIEYISFGDSPSKRKILINGKMPSESEKEFLENHLCSSLSQSMNFVMELSVYDFISMHIDCRKKNLSKVEKENLINAAIECANTLAGEKLSLNSAITQLSGGQSRALMISDIALVSDSPVVLIDEPENAGIDKEKILELLSENGKIVFVSTHDPVIALSCPKRIVIKNGAVEKILKRTEEEKILLEELKKFDLKLKKVRDNIRGGRNATAEC